ncbi:MAG: hypothetical protein WEB37_03210 [Bacteroidota bacterium]
MTEHTLLSYGGWERCLRISNGVMELVVTLDVGPRIIRCGFKNDRNHFVEYPEQLGRTGDAEYHSYGGHRLWIAPEERPRTYYPDNNPVDWKQSGEWYHIRPPAETIGFQKELSIRLDPEKPIACIQHRITNLANEPRRISAWSLSVMAAGGTAVIPHEPFQAHSEQLLPARLLVLWSYTDMADRRWKWGKTLISLSQDPNAASPQKIGAFNTIGWAAYLNGNQLFLKHFAADPTGQYPDFGCNCEFFTNSRMLELESLSPLKTLAQGESIMHEEHWLLARDVKPEASEESLRSNLESLISSFS